MLWFFCNLLKLLIICMPRWTYYKATHFCSVYQNKMQLKLQSDCFLFATTDTSTTIQTPKTALQWVAVPEYSHPTRALAEYKNWSFAITSCSKIGMRMCFLMYTHQKAPTDMQAEEAHRTVSCSLFPYPSISAQPKTPLFRFRGPLYLKYYTTRRG